MKLYQIIASVASQKNWAKKAKELAILKEILPFNGIEKECAILQESTKKRIVIGTAYWHSVKRQWIEHLVVITPSFEDEINIQIKGKSKDIVKENLHNIFREALMKEYAVEIESELD